MTSTLHTMQRKADLPCSAANLQEQIFLPRLVQRSKLPWLGGAPPIRFTGIHIGRGHKDWPREPEILEFEARVTFAFYSLGGTGNPEEWHLALKGYSNIAKKAKIMTGFSEKRST